MAMGSPAEMSAPAYAAMDNGSADGDRHIEAAKPTIRVVSGQVEISVPGDRDVRVYVYALTGQLVKNVDARPGVTTVDLPAGYYIVKCGHLSQRVVVR